MKRTPITPEELEATYRKCLERERIRRYNWRKTRQGAFESSFVSLDAILDNTNGTADKLRCIGTLGSVIPDLDGLPVCDRNKLAAACTKLRRHGKGHLVRTLQLIVKNVNNRKESICQIMTDTQNRIRPPSDATTGKGTNSAASSASKRTKGRDRKRGLKRSNLQSPEKKFIFS